MILHKHALVNSSTSVVSYAVNSTKYSVNPYTVCTPSAWLFVWVHLHEENLTFAYSLKDQKSYSGLCSLLTFSEVQGEAIFVYQMCAGENDLK